MQQVKRERIGGRVFEQHQEKSFKRRRVFIHPRLQGMCIALSVIPAVVATIFCTYSILHTGEAVLRSAREGPLVPIYVLQNTVENLKKEGYTEQTVASLEVFKSELSRLKRAMEVGYRNTIERWNRKQLEIFAVMFWCLVLVGSLAVVLSHRVVGPLYRLQRCIDRFSEGLDTGEIHLRRRDHYKELAASIENLRKRLVERGVLQKERLE